MKAGEIPLPSFVFPVRVRGAEQNWDCLSNRYKTGELTGR